MTRKAANVAAVVAKKAPAKKAAAKRARPPARKPKCEHLLWALECEADDDGDPVMFWACADCGTRTVRSVELEVLADLRRIAGESEVHGGRAAAALTLARLLDKGAGMATAAVAKELRATLDALSREGDAGDDQASALLDRILSA